MPRTPAADSVVRRPARTSLKTSIRCKSCLLTLSQPNLSPPNPQLRMGQRQFGFAELRHYRFALTRKVYIICVIRHCAKREQKQVLQAKGKSESGVVQRKKHYRTLPCSHR